MMMSTVSPLSTKRGLVFILSAPAGTGKTTLIGMLTQEFPHVVMSISLTTRQPRSGEVNGVDYHFISKEEFKRRFDGGELLESVELYGNHYGTSRLLLDALIAQGKHVFLVIDTQGALLLKQQKSDDFHPISIFIRPPSLEELEQRLQRRHTESPEVIKKRLAWAKQELEAERHYDYSIVNQELPAAYQALRSILIAEEHRIRYNL